MPLGSPVGVARDLRARGSKSARDEVPIKRTTLVVRACCPDAQSAQEPAVPPRSNVGAVGSPRTPCDGSVVAAPVRAWIGIDSRRPLRGSPRWPSAGAARSAAWVTCLLLLCSPAHAQITGTVTLTGKPNSKDETFVAAANGCGESPIRKTENWKVGPKGELGDVVIWIVDPKFQPATTTKLELVPEIEVKQQGCKYVPHVIAVQAGIPFKIINADPTLHNIRAKVFDGPGQPPGANIFNFGQAFQGATDEKEFDDPGTYTLQCDVHGWMQCWVMTLKDRNFGVTDTDGKFTIWQGPPIADGDYKIDAWHPRFAATLEQTIHVKNGTATVNFQFDGTKSF
jgi:plastocyanin